MARFFSDLFSTAQRSRRIALGVALIALVWVALFDSHSLVRRLRWQHQAKELRLENQRLANEIDQLSATLAAGLSRDDIERIARTQYGMSRPGEVVHRAIPSSAR